MPKSLLEQLPEIVANGRRQAERILESLETRQRVRLQTREVVLPAKDSAAQDWVTLQQRSAQATPGAVPEAQSATTPEWARGEWAKRFSSCFAARSNAGNDLNLVRTGQHSFRCSTTTGSCGRNAHLPKCLMLRHLTVRRSLISDQAADFFRLRQDGSEQTYFRSISTATRPLARAN